MISTRYYKKLKLKPRTFGRNRNFAKVSSVDETTKDSVSTFSIRQLVRGDFR